MTITNGYATLAQVRAALEFTAETDTSWDATLESYVEAVSRVIDGYCGRRFHSTAADETRYFQTRNPWHVETGDLLSVTTLQTDDNGDRTFDYTWTEGTHYELVPVNATLDGRPYSGISVVPSSVYFFPTSRSNPKAIKVVGKFGYCATGSHPEAVSAACVLGVAQTFNRKTAIYGVSGSAGLVHQLHYMLTRDVLFADMLAPYVCGMEKL